MVKKKLFALVQSEFLQNQFIEVIKEQVKTRPRCNQELLKGKVQEIEEVKRKTEKLADLVADDPEASLTKALVTKIRKNEELLEKCERDREHLEENLLLSAHDSLEPDFILSGIEKLRRDSFRKAGLAKKKAILREMIKGIHIHPDNALRIDFWAAGPGHNGPLGEPERGRR